MKLSDIDLNDLDTFEQATPHDQFKLLRAEDPVHRHAGAPGEEDFWAITKHADLKRISKDPARFSSEARGALPRDPPETALDQLRLIMLNMDPPKHRQYRELINQAFTPRMVKDLEGAVVGLVDRIIDNVAERGECDFVDEIAGVLPMEVICEMVGIPESDRRAIYDLGNRMVGHDDPDYLDSETPQQSEHDNEARTASAEMYMYAEKLKDYYKRNPADNLTTALLNAEVDGQKLTDLEFNAFFMLLSVAGNETTRTVTSNGMIDLMRNPNQQQRLAEDLSLIPTAVEEILRYNPAVHSFRRTAMADVEIRGRKISEGDKVILWYPSVNRDEEVFENADAFDITRNPNDHLSFGIGEHFCLGSHLARLELRKMFTGLMRRIPDIELAEEPRRLRSTFINGVKEMRVKFTPTAKLGSALD
jgi:cholest-4-en-3-one 26-monooxygenase